jgi:hypothetical protein
MCKSFHKKTAKEHIKEVKGFENQSARFVRDRLKRVLKILSIRVAKKPLLTEKMKKKRLAFAKKHRSWTERDWVRVMYSDKSTFRLANPRSVMVPCLSGISRYKQKYTVKTVKHSESVMVWGCFSATVGRNGLFFLPKNKMMNSKVNMGMQKDHLFPFMTIHGSESSCRMGRHVTQARGSWPPSRRRRMSSQ